MGQLSLTDIRCSRGQFVLHVPSLVIRQGEKIALLGENGCGKTTLLHILAGILPARGQMLLGTSRWDLLSQEKRAEHTAFLPQEAEVLFNLTVRELVALTLHEEKLLRGRERQAVLEATETAHLQDRTYPSLSGGEKRRAMLARVFCRQAEFIFLDEPTAPLDMRHAAQLMRHAASVPASVVAAMHDLNLAVRYFDRFLCMKHGSILFDRKKEDLNAQELEEIYGIGLCRCGDHFMPER